MGTPPPVRKRNNKAMTVAAVAAAIALIAIAAFYYYADPASGLMPRCAFHAITGYRCPGCGIQRALHALLHGDIAAAWHYNAFVFFAVPAAVFYIVVEAGRNRWPRLHARTGHPLIITAILIATLAFWLLRNL